LFCLRALEPALSGDFLVLLSRDGVYEVNHARYFCAGVSRGFNKGSHPLSASLEASHVMSEDETVFDRLGGHEAVESVVNDF